MTFYATPATGRRLDRPEEVHRARRRGGLQEGAGRGGAVPLRVVQSRASSWCVEAYEGYWRKTPAVKRLVFKSVPDESTRLAMLKRARDGRRVLDPRPERRGGEADAGPHPQGHVPDLHRVARVHRAVGPEVAVGDRRVRLAANLAIDRKAINEAEFLGFGKPAPSIIPRDFEFYWAPPAYPYDPARAKQLLRGGRATRRASTRSRSRPTRCTRPRPRPSSTGSRPSASGRGCAPLERAGFYKADQEKQFKHLVRVGSAAAGNAATRIEAFVISGGNPLLRRLSGHRRALPRPGGGDGQEAARGDAAQDPAAHARARDVRADRGAGVR